MLHTPASHNKVYLLLSVLPMPFEAAASSLLPGCGRHHGRLHHPQGRTLLVQAAQGEQQTLQHQQQQQP
jgi:hypothetical protein